MRPSTVKGTVARMTEGVFASFVFGNNNIFVAMSTDARFPPYFLLSMVMVGVSVSATFVSMGPAIFLVGSAGVVLGTLSIPGFTYLSLKNTDYKIKGNRILETKKFLKERTETVNLDQAKNVYTNKGLLSRLLGIAKVCIVKEDGGIFQIEYIEGYEDIETTLEDIINS